MAQRHYVVTDLRYELLVKPYRQAPPHAFNRSRVVLELRPGTASPGQVTRMEVVAEVSLSRRARHPRLEALALAVENDAVLEDLAAEVRQTWAARDLVSAQVRHP